LRRECTSAICSFVAALTTFILGNFLYYFVLICYIK
jgi:hypothetical protein